MIKPFFQSAQCRILGFRTNYLITSANNYKVRTDTVKGVVWVDLTPEEFLENYKI